MDICSQCIGEEFLRSEVGSAGAKATCGVCGTSNVETIAHEDLGDRIHQVIQDHFYLTSTEPEGLDYLLAREGLWEQPGEPILDLIQSLAMIDEDPAQEVLEHLAESYNAWGKDALIDPQPYDDEAQYEEREIDSYEFAESWSTFKSEIASRSRFFNRNAIEMLEHIFDGIEGYESGDPNSIIRILGPDDAQAVLYRSRIAKTLQQAEFMLSNVPGSLAPPNSEIARAGRMNAAGISVFYGSLDPETCVAEVRAPVGSWVVTAAFNPIRPLRLLDLDRLRKAFIEGSMFDSRHTEALRRLHFFRQLVFEFSAPVMPGEEESKYLPTQIVAEFLAMRADLNIDGILFPSSQVSGDGQNVVLFNRSSAAEPSDLPSDAEVAAHLIHGHPDDDEAEFVIFESVPEEEEEKNGERSKFAPFDLEFEFSDEQMGQLPELEPTLKLDSEKITVSRILGVAYESDLIDVRRLRTTNRKGSKEDF